MFIVVGFLISSHSGGRWCDRVTLASEAAAGSPMGMIGCVLGDWEAAGKCRPRPPFWGGRGGARSIKTEVGSSYSRSPGVMDGIGVAKLSPRIGHRHIKRQKLGERPGCCLIRISSRARLQSIGLCFKRQPPRLFACACAPDRANHLRRSGFCCTSGGYERTTGFCRKLFGLLFVG